MDNYLLGRAGAAPDVYTDLQGLQKLRNHKNSDEALRQVAEQFESMFLSLLLKNMRQANEVFEQDNPLSSSETRLARDLYDQQLSLNLAHGQGTGLAEVIYQQLSGRYGEQLRTRSGSENNASAGVKATAAEARVPAEPKPAGRVALADTPADFMQKLMPHARRAAGALGLDPLFLVAQAALETGWGEHVLADDAGRSSNNLFNIKAGADWRGDTVSVQALEYRDGLPVREQSRFKQYATLAESFADFVALIQRSPRYGEAMGNSQNAGDFAESLQKAGYATDPDYADKVMAIYRGLAESSAGITSPDAGRG